MRSSVSALLLALLIGVTGCSGNTPGSVTSEPAPDNATRTVTHEMGSATIPAKPQRVVSTSVVLSGHLLAVDAPLVGSGGTKPHVPGADENGWWLHWSTLAKERKVASLFHSGNLDLERVLAAKPDVIFVSATGGDSFADKYEQLNKIAPTVVIDYNSHSWEEVTQQVGEVLNLQANATKVLKEFDDHLNQATTKIAAPTTPVDLGVYSGAQGGLAVGLPTAPQAQILQKLGITVADTGVTPEKGRKDFAFATPEQTVRAMKAPELLLVGNDDNELKALMSDSRFATIRSVAAKEVKALGLPSYKLDLYAATDMVDQVVKVYGK